jgi:hypothetical protein
VGGLSAALKCQGEILAAMISLYASLVELPSGGLENQDHASFRRAHGFVALD